jgi:hypothetical protein
MKGLQEKFQTILPPQPNEDDGTEWKTFESARNPKEAPGRGFEMPVAQTENKHPMLRQIAGCTDFSYDTNPEAFDKGFTRKAMNGTDDLYTGEHIDHFYGEAVDEDGKTGFVERNNYLDRS